MSPTGCSGYLKILHLMQKLDTFRLDKSDHIKLIILDLQLRRQTVFFEESVKHFKPSLDIFQRNESMKSRQNFNCKRHDIRIFLARRRALANWLMMELRG